MTDPLHSIKGVEIFAVGRWNGDQYTEQDLDDMVVAFDQVGYRPPVKIGHSTTVGERAYGWVSRIYRRGSKLIGDFIDIPDAVYQVIKERGFDAVSSEIYWELNRAGQTFRRVLKAVALLGSETPAANLMPLRSVVHAIAGPFRRYTIEWETNPMTQQHDDPGVQLTHLANEFMRQHANQISFRDALDAVKATQQGAALLKAYNQKAKAPGTAAKAYTANPRVTTRIETQDEVGKEVDRKAVAFLEANPEIKNYQTAVRAVFTAEPELARRYGLAGRPVGVA